MEDYLKVTFPEDGDIVYYADAAGQMELSKLTDSLTILKIYFPDLNVGGIDDDFYENSTEVMLTNYPVTIKHLDELDGQTIEIKEGWTKDIMYTMLSIHDGQPINNTKIHFKKNTDGSFNITWTGWYGEGEGEYPDDVILNINAFPAEDIVTALCMYDAELVEFFDKKI